LSRDDAALSAERSEHTETRPEVTAYKCA